LRKDGGHRDRRANGRSNGKEEGWIGRMQNDEYSILVQLSSTRIDGLVRTANPVATKDHGSENSSGVSPQGLSTE